MRLEARAAAEAIAQILRTTSSLAFANGLNPAQWAAIRYFAHAEPNARSVVAFARYHRTTKGTASQTIAALQKKGLLDRTRSDKDRRTVSLELTAQGWSMLEDDPLNELAGAIDQLPDDELQGMAQALDKVLAGLLERWSMRGADDFDAEEDGASAQAGD